MTLPLLIIVSWSCSLFLASLIVVGAFDLYAGSFYWFTVPFIAASGICAATAFAGLCWRARRSVFSGG